MKIITKIIIIFMLVSAVFAGCNAAPSAPEYTPQPSSTPENAPAVSSPITIIVPHFYSDSYDASQDDQNTAYLQEMMKANGFDVEFDIVYYNLDSYTCYEEYFSYLAQSLRNDNTIALVPGYKSHLLSDYVDMADLSKLIKNDAPSYYQYVQRNAFVAAGNNHAVVSAVSNLSSVSVVLISNPLVSKYADSIEESEEYMDFIKWAAKQNKSMIPSVVLTFHDDITSRSNILYDLVLPQEGYIPLGSYLNKTYSLCVDAKKPEKVYDATEFDFYDPMLESLEVSVNHLKIVVKHENHFDKDFSEYSSVVMPLGDLPYYADIADYNFVPENYTMEILNPHMFLERTHENAYFAAAAGQNQSHALQLIDWIYSDMGNYLLTKYGEAGVNYSFDENNHIQLSDAGRLYVDSSPLFYMINNIEFEAQLHSTPSNYLDEINSIEYVKNDNFSKQYENYQELITAKNYIYNSTARFIERWERSVRALELVTERKVNHVPGDFGFRNIDDLIDEISR